MWVCLECALFGMPAVLPNCIVQETSVATICPITLPLLRMGTRANYSPSSPVLIARETEQPSDAWLQTIGVIYPLPWNNDG